METKKALLVLIGGRPLPNMLTLMAEKPAVVVGIVSQDETWKMEEVRKAIKIYAGLSGYQPDIIDSWEVDAFELEDVKNACVLAVEKYAGSDWIFNITASTKIMGIAAYEVAKEIASKNSPVRCWYLDTQHSRVISPIGEGRDNKIFKVTMKEYAAACNCEVGAKDPEFADEKLRQSCQNNWVPFVQLLVQTPTLITNGASS